MIYVKMIYIYKTSKNWYWSCVSTTTTEGRKANIFFANPFLKQSKGGGTEKQHRELQSLLRYTQTL